MEWPQLIGMIIALIAVAYSLIATIRDIFNPKKKQTQRPQPDYYSPKSPQEVVEDYLRQIEKREEEDNEYEEIEQEEKQLHLRKPPQVPPLPVPNIKATKAAILTSLKESMDFRSPLEGFKQKSAIDDRKLQISLHAADDVISEKFKDIEEGVLFRRPKNVPIKNALQKMHSKKMLVIAYEVLSPPVGMRTQKTPWT